MELQLRYLLRIWSWSYITLPKLKKHTKEITVKGEGMTFYSPEEVNIAYNEAKLDLHASIKVKMDDVVDGEL